MKIVFAGDDALKELMDKLFISLRLLCWPDAELLCADGQNITKLIADNVPEIIFIGLNHQSTGLDALEKLGRLVKSETFLSRTIIVTISEEPKDESQMAQLVDLGATKQLYWPSPIVEFLIDLKAIMIKVDYLSSVNKRLPNPIVSNGKLTLRTDLHQLSYEGKTIHVTNIENLLLGILMRNIGNPVPYPILAEGVWGDDYPGANDSLRVHKKRIAEKLTSFGLPEHTIGAVNSVGYKMEQL